MAPHHDYVPGCTYLTCTFCGRRRLFPDELALCDDKKFRCLDACMEKSIMSIDREIAASHYKREAPPLGIGYASEFDRATFRSDSVNIQKVVLPSWTPTTVLYDDFAVLPGAVGSSWSLAVTGTGAVSALADGGCRFTPGTGACRASVASMAVPTPLAGNFYCRVAFSSPDTSVTLTGAGVVDVSFGARDTGTQSVIVAGAVNAGDRRRYYSKALGNTFTFARSREELTIDPCIGEMWWDGTGFVFYRITTPRGASINRYSYSDTPQNYTPFLGHTNGGLRLDVTECVFMV